MRYLASEAPLHVSPEEIFQGPVADALTHVGQIALLRRLAQAPIRGRTTRVPRSSPAGPVRARRPPAASSTESSLLR